MRCDTHPSESAAGTCRCCHETYCAGCLVYALGASVSPYCLDCALGLVANWPAPARRPVVAGSLESVPA